MSLSPETQAKIDAALEDKQTALTAGQANEAAVAVVADATAKQVATKATMESARQHAQISAQEAVVALTAELALS